MQNGFIDFVDIKLQSAEHTRLRVKNVIDRKYKLLCESPSEIQLTLRLNSIVDSLECTAEFELIDYNTQKRLLELVEEVYTSRCDELRRENR